MAKRIPNAAEVAASLGQPTSATTTKPAKYQSPDPADERAEIVRSIRFTRQQIEYLNRIAGEQTTRTGRSVSISEIIRQLIDEKCQGAD